MFPSGHIQQLISHGHICVNGRIVRHGNVKIRGHDLIHFKKTSNSFLKGPKILTLPGEESKLLRIKSLAPLGFTKLFYITYRNMYLVNRDLIISTPNQVYYRGIEKNIMCAFHAIELDQSSYLLWPIFSLLKVADFVKTIKPYVLTDKGRVSLTKEDK